MAIKPKITLGSTNRPAHSAICSIRTTLDCTRTTQHLASSTFWASRSIPSSTRATFRPGGPISIFSRTSFWAYSIGHSNGGCFSSSTRLSAPGWAPDSNWSSDARRVSIPTFLPSATWSPGLVWSSATVWLPATPGASSVEPVSKLSTSASHSLSELPATVCCSCGPSW